MSHDPDRHEFTPDPDEPETCIDCGDNEGGNDHLDPADPSHVWMDVEGLTAADIDALNTLCDAGHSAQDVADWAGAGGDYRAAPADALAALRTWLAART